MVDVPPDQTKPSIVQSAGTVEYTDCISADE